ncbi:type III polyketide synthase [Dongia soli]|uniref:3-oxoacyl-[acyl-carrier-protein] synthase III C-terminal domain-containing protein n=1 Tax=Dongia soli TaxID=600628 RepID=A0ABU5E5M5_9PROT|nr:3-oxoacyl-[acyl-carrier-protein] synthase III C-terminal domain-containing protein [Dongia soli]MDY0881444.1 3-oxoacyl-[acyl-carrier-protein] synthase III C-terminal domain-containing protein [Dongia soli]
MDADPTILSIATSVPPHRLLQGDVEMMAPELFDQRRSNIERLMPVFQNAGISQRFSCVPLDWYREPHGWQERNQLYIDHAVDLLERAASEALMKAGRQAKDIAAIVVASTTGIATPSLDALILNRLNLPSHVQRLPIFGLGCGGGVVGLGHAATLARLQTEGDVLFLAVELCGLTFRQGDMSNSNIIAAALFGDGAAAMVLGRPGSRGPRLGPAGLHTWPDSLDVMGWNVCDDGLGVIFSRDIPTIVRQELAAAIAGFLAHHKLERSDLDGFICHPGGMKVLDALEDCLDLPRGNLAAAREILREYGNMSAVTVLFVLQRMLAGGLSGRYLMSALGPGFTAAFQLIEA